MAVDQNSFIREGPFFANKTFLSRIFRKLYVYLSRNPCWATTPLMKVHSSPASRNPLPRTSCYWLGIFLAWLTGPLPSKCARIRGTANTRGLGVCLSQSLTFGSLAAAFGACFLRLQKATLGSTSGRCKDVPQDHGIWLWGSLTFGSLAATYEGKGKCGVPFSCRTPGHWAAGGGSP